MTFRIGWLTPFNDRTGVGTFSKAVTDAMPSHHGARTVDLTVIAPLVPGLYATRHRLIDIESASAASGFYDLFDVLVYNIGNNLEHHRQIFEILRNKPGVVICHDYVYQHFLAAIVQERGDSFLDYVALSARYGSASALRTIRESNITGQGGLRYAPWDSELVAAEPLAAPILQLASSLVVHSNFAETYARAHFRGPILSLGMPCDQHPSRVAPSRSRLPSDRGARRVLLSFGHVQSTKCIDDVLLAIARSRKLRDEVLYVVSGFSGNGLYCALLRDIVDRHGLEECVQFALDLPEADLAELSASADGFVNIRYPNTEGASVSLIEQMMTGKPVIVLDSGCYGEVPDDAVVKIARAGDIPAIGRALLRMLDDREALAQLGRRGRDHAMRFDCAGYARSLLDHVHDHVDLLRRRASFTAEHRLGGQPRDEGDEPEVGPWADALCIARTSFDLLDQGRLHRDPGLLCELAPEQLADYIQAAFLRDGFAQAGAVAIRDYLRGAEDPVIACRILDIVRQAAIDNEPNAIERLPDLVPHGDVRFWMVVSGLGLDALARVCHQACFGNLPAGQPALAADELTRSDFMYRRRLADELAARDPRDLRTSKAELNTLLAWLRDAGGFFGADQLDPIPVGRRITVGSSEHGRFLQLFGFFDIEADHAWTGAEESLVYLRPPRAARSISLFGHTLVPSETAVTVAANMASRQSLSRSTSDGVHVQVQVDLPEGDRVMWTEPLCLSISTAPCYSPAELGLSADKRPLGFCLQHVLVA